MRRPLAFVALFAAAMECLAGDEPANLFPNPSFEEWNEDGTPATGIGTWSATLADEFGKPRFTHIGASDAAAHSGRYSLHMQDERGGQYDDIYKFTLPKQLVASFRGKGLKFSAWVQLVGKGAEAEVGIGAISKGRESGRVSAVADFPRNVKATDGFERLCCYLKVPEDAQTLALTFRSANGFYSVGEAYFDDCELIVIPREDVPETDAERERRLRTPFVPNREAMAWAEKWTRPMSFADDGFERPAICGGNLVNADGSFFHPIGVWINPVSDDWSKKAVTKHGINHPAYTMPPGKAVFGIVGCNAAQISGAPNTLAAASQGYVKDVKAAKRRTDAIREYWRGFGDTWLVVDFAFGHEPAIKAQNMDLYERMDQKCKAWHWFVPFCPECEEGKDYYRAYFETGVKFALDAGLNVGLWELFNESVYGCECKCNKRGFASQAEAQYGTIGAANAAWGTDFVDFNELGRIADYGQFKGLWSEWCAFLSTRYAKVLAEWRDYIRTIDKRPNVYFTEQLAGFNIWNGMMDYRKIAGVLDALTLEGGWGYGGGTDNFKAKDEMEAVVFSGSGHWYVLDFFQAITRGRKPVFNDEHNCARYEDGKRVSSRASDYVTSMWLEFFHGIAGSHIYIWEKRAQEWTTFEEAKANVLSPSYKSQAMLNPYNWPTGDLDAFWRFRRELARYQGRISEFPRTPTPRVAIYHSQTTAAMAPKFGRPIKTPMSCAYAAVLHALYPVTFTFDDELTEGRLPSEVEAIVVPAADFEAEAVRVALEAFVARGGVVVADRRAFSFDEHGRKAKGQLAGAILYDAGPTNAAPILAALEAAGIKKTAELVPIDGLGDIAGADVQVIDRGDFKLVLVVNLIAGGAERRVRLALPVAEEGHWIVTDAVTDASLSAPYGGEIWTSGDIRKGIEFQLPYQERVLIAIRDAKGMRTLNAIASVCE